MLTNQTPLPWTCSVHQWACFPVGIGDSSTALVGCHTKKPSDLMELLWPWEILNDTGQTDVHMYGFRPLVAILSPSNSNSSLKLAHIRLKLHIWPLSLDWPGFFKAMKKTQGCHGGPPVIHRYQVVAHCIVCCQAMAHCIYWAVPHYMYVVKWQPTVYYWEVILPMLLSGSPLYITEWQITIYYQVVTHCMVWRHDSPYITEGAAHCTLQTGSALYVTEWSLIVLLIHCMLHSLYVIEWCPSMHYWTVTHSKVLW